MNKIYYFSKKTLQLVEVKNHKLKLVLFFIGAFLLSNILLLAALAIFTPAFSPFGGDNPYSKEYEMLQSEYKNMAERYDSLNVRIDSVLAENNDLRIAVNLPPLSPDYMQMGKGGGSFDSELHLIDTDNSENIEKAFELLENVENKLTFQKQIHSEINKALKNNKELYKSIPAILPTRGRLSSAFGMRKHPILGIRRMHTGIDITARTGTQVQVSGEGTVISTGYRGGYGLAIEVDHGFGYRTLYAHLSKVKVKVGQKVKRGDVIGLVGNTGLSTGPHLHYEVIHNGVKLNPMLYFFPDIQHMEPGSNQQEESE